MKEGSWHECVESNKSVNISLNKAKSRSLFDTALGRIKFLGKLETNEEDVNYIFEGLYSSVMETMQAIVVLNGFKVLSHVCLGYYIRDVLERKDLYDLFDDCRYKRNSLLYYGRKMDSRVALASIKKARKLFSELERVFRENIGN